MIYKRLTTLFIQVVEGQRNKYKISLHQSLRSYTYREDILTFSFGKDHVTFAVYFSLDVCRELWLSSTLPLKLEWMFVTPNLPSK